MLRFVSSFSSWFPEMIDYNLSSEINSLLPKLLLVKEFITTESKLEQQPRFPQKYSHEKKRVCLPPFIPAIPGSQTWLGKSVLGKT